MAGSGVRHLGERRRSQWRPSWASPGGWGRASSTTWGRCRAMDHGWRRVVHAVEHYSKTENIRGSKQSDISYFWQSKTYIRRYLSLSRKGSKIPLFSTAAVRHSLYPTTTFDRRGLSSVTVLTTVGGAHFYYVRRPHQAIGHKGVLCPTAYGKPSNIRKSYVRVLSRRT
jgi:hypothetical protein